MTGTRRSHVRVPFAGRYITPIGDSFASVEALSGIVVLVAAAAALVWANSPATDSYTDLWGWELSVGIGDWSIDESLAHWVNDGLMAIFFFVVGLEIKRELVTGELREPRKAALPVLAAAGGMAVPALIYLVWNSSGAAVEGWAIPMATDLAFALGVLALLASRVPSTLKLFLLTLAIVDDVGAIVVIAVFYSEGVSLVWLLGAIGTLVVMLSMRRLRIQHPLFYVLPAFVVWLCTYESGVHATIAGVALGLLAPTGEFHGRPVIDQVERQLHPWTSFLIVPVFALANAGVNLGGDVVGDALTSRITLGVVTGLVVGKAIGIVGATALGLRLRIGRLPDGVTTRHLVGVGLLGGIGFTVSLFVAELSFAGARLSDAKLGIFAASLTAGILGAAVLAFGRSSGVSVYALVHDLMDRSKVSAAVPGVEFAADPGECATADVVVVDLGRHADAVAELRALLPDARIVAFGRHDNPEALAAAEAAGADLVLPRSRFFHDPATALMRT